MLLCPRPIRLLLRVLLALLLGLALLALGLVLLAQSNPRNLTDRALAMISARSGLTISAEAVSVAVLPLPSLALTNAAVQGADWQLHAAYATVRPDFLALLRGAFVPRHIRLLRPRLEGTLPLPLAATLPPQADTAEPGADPKTSGPGTPTPKTAVPPAPAAVIRSGDANWAGLRRRPRPQGRADAAGCAFSSSARGRSHYHSITPLHRYGLKIHKAVRRGKVFGKFPFPTQNPSPI